MIVAAWNLTTCLLLLLLTTTTRTTTRAFTVVPSHPVAHRNYPHFHPAASLARPLASSSFVRVVADAQGEDIRKRKRRNNNDGNSNDKNSDDYSNLQFSEDHEANHNADDEFVDDDEEEETEEESWTPTSNGGFLPNLRKRLKELTRRNKSQDQLSSLPSSSSSAAAASTTPSSSANKITTKNAPKEPVTLVHDVTTLQDYKHVVMDERDADYVCVRFYSPWCRACQAIAAPFRQLARQYATSSSHNHNAGVKFVQVAITEDNAFLAKGLGIPSLPFGHLYHTTAGLVEERSLNKKVFKEFKQVLKQYVDGQCQIDWDDDDHTTDGDDDSIRLKSADDVLLKP